ncbi:phospholipid:diacylglycerol acyltransferase [Marchantia polymorpha subsp. ruderalis]|uniref:phospholipid:diacylglycerol acyltransferase n=2 Tax=Marchantia polymorpha TaxID=3197 RepID=A0A176W2L9_MARPO|nr:hypothetical protein AXG93_3310s1040 [Marchantia polymorpha subsp. ruderalis]PTQ47348.1 hypothetical protein MARPO_0008s0119 [Marchantia polymorpha]BBN19482.1 hypothetical protein Mp_8g11030 [Marchantia polymorpha subsp. ruderalis]|eukprot:PTQ47348.1 hypothetical protein MARPO_0008s0119 [Marchantia polymorpha]
MQLRRRKQDGGGDQKSPTGDEASSAENQERGWDESEEKEKHKKSGGETEKKHGEAHKHQSHQNQSSSHGGKQAHSDSNKPDKPDKHEKPQHKLEKKPPSPAKLRPTRWRCVDNCCWLIGYVCVCWWMLLALYNALPTLPQYVTEKITGPAPDPPGVKLAKEGLLAKHPVVFVPGIVTGGLELWQGKPCADGLFRKRLWGGTFGEVYKRPYCWMEHMSLDNETGLDLPGMRVRAVSGLVAADYFAPGYFVWAVLIENLARIGYEERNMYMAAYDWRLSFQNTEVRDKTLTKLKNTIETLYETNDNNKVVVVPHSMGALYFLHFMKWVEAPKPMGGGGGDQWCAKYLKAVMNIGGPFLGVSKSFTGLFSAEAKDIAVARAIAPGVLDSELFGLQTLQHIMRVTRTWDAAMSMLPKGGEKVWGNADWSPEEGYDCSKGKRLERSLDNDTDSTLGPHGKPYAHYGRLVSFGLDSAQKPSSVVREVQEECAANTSSTSPVRSNVTCGEVWTEYHEMTWDDLESIPKEGYYTASSVIDLLRKVAPNMMRRADANWAFGLAENPSDPKYNHHKYWANPFETTLPNAPDMEVYCMYGVGILTERSYIYKLSPSSDSCYIPFRIDTSAEGESEGCLKGGVHFIDGDETVPALSAGYMCQKGWRGKTRYNPYGSQTYVKEYNHAPPANLLEGRGTQSGSHVDIMGNFALIEDVMRVAAGSSGEDIGGDRTYSDIPKWSERIKVEL